MFNPFNTPSSLRVIQLVLVETGTYNPQYRRPYVTQINGSTLNGIVTDIVSQHGNKLDSSVLARHAGNILIPSANPECEAFVPNGWSTPRIRFSLTLECMYTVGGKIRIHIQGYTEYADLSYNNKIDPRMQFFINSITTTTFAQQVTQFGAIEVESVRDCSHLLVNPQASNIMNPSNNMAYSMRPQDVFGTMQHGHVNDAASFYGSEMMLDTRCILRGTPTKSNRKNALSSSYVCGMVNSYTNSLMSSNFENTESEVLGKAMGVVGEDSPMTDPFLNAIMGIMGNNQISNTFTYGDLNRLDPNTDRLTNVVRHNNSQMGGLHQYGQTAHWGGADRLTHAATFIAHAVPSIMSSMGVTSYSFIASNNSNTPLVITSALKSIGQTGEMTALHAAIESRIAFEVCNIISYNNQSRFEMTVNCNIFNDTTIDISIDNSGISRFVAPTFGDSSYCPVVTNSVQRTTEMASDLGIVMNNIRDGLSEVLSYKPL